METLLSSTAVTTTCIHFTPGILLSMFIWCDVTRFWNCKVLFLSVQQQQDFWCLWIVCTVHGFPSIDWRASFTLALIKATLYLLTTWLHRPVTSAVYHYSRILAFNSSRTFSIHSKEIIFKLQAFFPFSMDMLKIESRSGNWIKLHRLLDPVLCVWQFVRYIDKSGLLPYVFKSQGRYPRRY